MRTSGRASNIGALQHRRDAIPNRPPPNFARRGLSIELKLPIAFCILLALLVGVYIAVAYREVQHTARDAAVERVTLLSSNLAQMPIGGGGRSSALLRALSAPELVAAVSGGPVEPARAALERLRTDSQAIVLLLDATHRPVVQAGPQPEPAAQAHLERALRDAGELRQSVLQSRLFRLNEHITFWSIYPIPDAQNRRGYAAVLRGLARPYVTDMLARLIGKQTGVLLANEDDTQGPWMNLSGQPMDPPSDYHPLLNRYTRHDTVFIAHAEPMQNTPWMVVAETPEGLTHARPLQFLRRTGALGLLLVLLGTVAAWLVSGRFVRPLRELGRAADAIAVGRYDQPVELRRGDELGAVAQAFNHMASAVQQAVSEAEASRAQAELANKAKSEFLATMSHEIRTPINAMLGYADLLELGIAGPVTPEQRAQLARIRLSGQHLTGLINDLLDFARLETGKLTVRRELTSADPSIRTALTVIEPPASAKAIDLHVEADAEVSYIGDRQRVEQILVNLLDNAVKFTPNGGNVTLRVHTIERNGRPRTRFVVEDTGIGIAAEQIETMFQPFVQGQTGYTRVHGGSGLGLTISRRFAHLMGGEITVESERGKGARFVLELPAGAEALANSTT